MSKRERWSFCLFLLDSSTHHKQACEENEFEVGSENAKTEKKEARKAEECSQTGSSRGVGGDAAGCCASL